MSLSDAIAHMSPRRGWLYRGAGDVRALDVGARLFPDHPFLRIAHRGAAALEPENSLRGIEAALRYGVEMVEVDVRPCAGGTLVLSHDDNLERITGYEGTVSTTVLATLQRLDIGKGERMPTLEETTCGFRIIFRIAGLDAEEKAIAADQGAQCLGQWRRPQHHSRRLAHPR